MNPFLFVLIGLIAIGACGTSREPLVVLRAPGEDPSELVNTGPKPVRVIQPDYPRAARDKRLKAEFVLDVTIDENGHVQDVTIVERYLYRKGSDEREPVSKIGYGLEKAVTKAAYQWLFRPAYENSHPVPSNLLLTFNFGML